MGCVRRLSQSSAHRRTAPAGPQCRRVLRAARARDRAPRRQPALVRRVDLSAAQDLEPVQGNLGNPVTALDRALAFYYRWYAPWFYAYSLASARNHEYESDSWQLGVTSAQTLGRALIQVELASRFLSDVFGHASWRESRKRRSRLIGRTRCCRALSRSWRKNRCVSNGWQKPCAGTRRSTTPTRASPSASLRWRFTDLPPPATTSAALKMLGSAAQPAIDHCDDVWRAENSRTGASVTTRSARLAGSWRSTSSRMAPRTPRGSVGQGGAALECAARGRCGRHPAAAGRAPTRLSGRPHAARPDCCSRPRRARAGTSSGSGAVARRARRTHHRPATTISRLAGANARPCACSTDRGALYPTSDCVRIVAGPRPTPRRPTTSRGHHHDDDSDEPIRHGCGWRWCSERRCAQRRRPRAHRSIAREGVSPDLIVGCSSGALYGAAIATGMSHRQR